MLYLQTSRGALLFFLTGLLGVTNLHAADGHGHRQHEAHIHGIASLTLAAENREVQVMLSSPAANLLGFEHPPANEAERTAVARAKTSLEETRRLFGFPEQAACQSVHTAVRSELFATHREEHGERHERDRAHASESHRHAEEDHGAGHADITAEYHFECAHPGKLDRLHVRLFEVFPAIEHLEVQYIMGDKQGSAELTHANPVLTF